MKKKASNRRKSNSETKRKIDVKTNKQIVPNEMGGANIRTTYYIVKTSRYRTHSVYGIVRIVVLCELLCLFGYCCSCLFAVCCWCMFLFLLCMYLCLSSAKRFENRPIHVQQLTLLCVRCLLFTNKKTFFFLLLFILGKQQRDRPSADCFIDASFCIIFQYHQISRPVRIDSWRSASPCSDSLDWHAK